MADVAKLAAANRVLEDDKANYNHHLREWSFKRERMDAKLQMYERVFAESTDRANNLQQENEKLDVELREKSQSSRHFEREFNKTAQKLNQAPQPSDHV